MISPTVKTPHTAASPRSKGVHVQVIATPRQIASLFGNSGNSKMQRPSTTFEILQRLNGNYYRPRLQALPEEISLARVSNLGLSQIATLTLRTASKYLRLRALWLDHLRLWVSQLSSSDIICIIPGPRR